MTLKPEQVIAICDTREQLPLDLSPLTVERTALKTGDYALKGFEKELCIERKSLVDMIACVGRERSRFEAEIARMAEYKTSVIVVEGSWYQIEMRQYRGTVSPNAILGSLMSWQLRGIQILMAHDHHTAGRLVAKLLWLTAKHVQDKALALPA